MDTFKIGIQEMMNFLLLNYEKLSIYVDQTQNFKGQFICQLNDFFYFFWDGLEVHEEIFEILQENDDYKLVRDQKGKCLIAQRDFLPGELIFRETPLMFYDHQTHLTQGSQNCSICNNFFIPEFFPVFNEQIERIEPSTFHMVAQLV